MARRAESYVDTSALVAFADKSDGFHALFRRLFAEPPPLVTTPLVIAEGHGWFLKRYDRRRALQFVAMIEEMKFLKTQSVGEGDLTSAAAVLRRFSDQNLTLVDAVGLQIMNERNIRICWSTDFHLGLAGASLVIHEH